MIRRRALILLLLFTAGCASVTPAQLRAHPDGVYSFKTSMDYRSAYEKTLFHARTCFDKANSGDTVRVRSEVFPEHKRASISIVKLHAIGDNTLMTMDFSQSDEKTSAIDVYYAQHRFRSAAELVEDWVTKDSNECRTSSMVLDCVCFLTTVR